MRMETTTRGRQITLTVDGLPVPAYEGESIHAALTAAGIRVLSRSPKTGRPKGVFCGMGICYECLVYIDGTLQRACMTRAADGMEIQTGEGA